ncbi:MAG TPA: diacylglycerol kinase family protein [Tepidisphaeraceae bacterium]|jgi:diacylglycerol kinase (ATP)|nr:diacylglycerol kinase family protein [Tepidisphaeraceae bacterium]
MTTPREPFQLAARLRSFRYAFAGLRRMLRCQHNAWLHAVATVFVVTASFLLHLSRADWCWIILAISLVWAAEAFNTAVEFLANAITTDFHPLIRDAKDVAAGAVLLTAFSAAVIGTLIFWPHLTLLFR